MDRRGAVRGVLLAALAEGDRAAVGDNAHKLKGTCMLMGFRALVKTSAQIEHLATQTQEVVPVALGQQLLREMELTQKALRHFELRQAV